MENDQSRFTTEKNFERSHSRLLSKKRLWFFFTEYLYEQYGIEKFENHKNLQRAKFFFIYVLPISFFVS